MFDFDEVCRQAEKLDPVTYAAIITEKSQSVVAGIQAVTGDAELTKTLFTMLLLGAVVSDGKITEEEFGLIGPFLSEAVEQELTYEDAKEFMAQFKPDAKEYKDLIDSLTDLFGAVSEELKADIVTVCLLVCAADGKVSKREQKWLKKLID